MDETQNRAYGMHNFNNYRLRVKAYCGLQKLQVPLPLEENRKTLKNLRMNGVQYDLHYLATYAAFAFSTTLIFKAEVISTSLSIVMCPTWPEKIFDIRS